MPQKKRFITCEICGDRASRKGGEKRKFMTRFPIDEARCKEWVKLVGKEDLAYIPIEKLHTIKYVCGDHFHDRYFNKKKSRLKRSAIPSKNLKAPLTDEILSEFPCHIYKDSDDVGSQITNYNDDPVSGVEAVPSPCSSDIAMYESEINLQSSDKKTTLKRARSPSSEPSTSDQLHLLEKEKADQPNKRKKIKAKSGFKMLEHFKLKLQNVLHNSTFCGICLGNDKTLSSTDEVFEIIVNERTLTKTLRDIIDAVFKEETYRPASSHICIGCMDNMLQFYIFLENAKETSQLLDTYISDLSSKAKDIFNDLTDIHSNQSWVEIKNIIIVLQNNIHDGDSLEPREAKDELIIQTNRSLPEDCQQIREDNIKCVMCRKTFPESEFKSHNCQHRCPQCAEVPCIHYKYLKSCREQSLSKADKMKCVDCDYSCKKREVLLAHVNRHHLKHHPYACDKCRKLFYSKFVLKAHILRFHENCFVCQFCDSEFSNVNTYDIHVQSCEDIRRMFACANCPASFDSSDSLTNHIKCRHTTDIFPCGLCKKTFQTDSERKEHIIKVHMQLQTKNMDKNFECVVCQKQFVSRRDLVQHMKTHGPNITYPCRICNTEFQTSRQFRAHNRRHIGPFASCHICGKEMRAMLLKKHLTTHSDSIETCETCGRSFRNIILLKFHQRVHLESVPCPQCNKRIHPARLRTHWRTHGMGAIPKKRIKKQDKLEMLTMQIQNIEQHTSRMPYE